MIFTAFENQEIQVFVSMLEAKDSLFYDNTSRTVFAVSIFVEQAVTSVQFNRATSFTDAELQTFCKENNHAVSLPASVPSFRFIADVVNRAVSDPAYSESIETAEVIQEYMERRREEEGGDEEEPLKLLYESEADETLSLYYLESENTHPKAVDSLLFFTDAGLSACSGKKAKRAAVNFRGELQRFPDIFEADGTTNLSRSAPTDVTPWVRAFCLGISDFSLFCVTCLPSKFCRFAVMRYFRCPLVVREDHNLTDGFQGKNRTEFGYQRNTFFPATQGDVMESIRKVYGT